MFEFSFSTHVCEKNYFASEISTKNAIFAPILLTMKKQEILVTAKSPSNIAVVKYWGKHGCQLPNNPSISFTLSNCFTETSVEYNPKFQCGMQFLFEGVESPKFKEKIEKYIEKHGDLYRFDTEVFSHLKVESRNSFPHSSGIASSASSMSALVLCFLKLEKALNDDATPLDLRRASMLARLASGSASRSVYPVMALWGETPCVSDSSDEYAVPLGNMVAPVFKTYHDTILIVSNKEKSVSSRVGHALMEGHPLAEKRYLTARYNTKRLLEALRTADLTTFIDIAESEAVQLHELMATSNPPYKLVEPNTLKIIDEVHKFRKNTDVPVCFTLDAGPNVHLLFPDEFSEKVNVFINDKLKSYCVDNQYISDIVKVF